MFLFIPFYLYPFEIGNICTILSKIISQKKTTRQSKNQNKLTSLKIVIELFQQLNYSISLTDDFWFFFCKLLLLREKLNKKENDIIAH